MRCEGESPDQSLVVKQRPVRACGTGVHTPARMNPDRGLYLADGTLCWVVFTDSERLLRWLGSRGCPVRLPPSGQRALKAVTDRVRSQNRDNSARWGATSYP